MQEVKLDLRVRRTRDALLGAFAALIQTHRYEDLTPAHIYARAGVSRSTFYAHFTGKEALLAGSITVPFSVLADTVNPDMDPAHLVQLLDHFWQNRALARAIFRGTVRYKTIEVLIGVIQERLKTAGLHRRDALTLPIRLASIQLAELLLAPITSWLLGESKCTPQRLATGLRGVSVAALKAMQTSTRGR